MKANLLLTAIVFTVLPSSIASAYSSPSKDTSDWQDFVCNYGLQQLQGKQRGDLAACSLSPTFGSSILSQNCTEATKNSQPTSKLQVTNLDPQAAINYNNQGVAKFNSGDNYGAILEYDRAIAINPKYAESYVNRGIAKFKLGNIQGAIKDYNLAIAINPQDGEAYYNRGIAQFESGEERSAIKDFDRALALNPQDAEVYGNRGFAKSTLGDNRGAIADFQQAAKLFREQGQTADYQKMMGLIRQMSTY